MTILFKKFNILVLYLFILCSVISIPLSRSSMFVVVVVMVTVLSSLSLPPRLFLTF